MKWCAARCAKRACSVRRPVRVPSALTQSTGIPLTDVDPAHVPGTQNQAPRSSITKDLMKRSALSLHATRMAALTLALVTLAGCDTLNDWFASDRVNYKGAGSAPPLAVPGDLTTTPTDQRYVAPPANLALGGATQRAVTAAGNSDRKSVV